MIPAIIIWLLCVTFIISIVIETDYQTQICNKSKGEIISHYRISNVSIEIPFDRFDTLNFSNPFIVPFTHNVDAIMTVKTLTIYEEFIIEGILHSFEFNISYFLDNQNEEVFVVFEQSELMITFDYNQYQSILNWTTTIKCSDMAKIYNIPVPFWLQ